MYRLFAILFVASLAYGCASFLKEDLGHGFRVYSKSEPTDNAFESVRHYKILRFRQRDLGEVGFVSVAESGMWALYEQSGGLHLFSVKNGHIADVTEGDFSIPRHVEWLESDGRAVVSYWENRLPSTIHLNSSMSVSAHTDSLRPLTACFTLLDES